MKLTQIIMTGLCLAGCSFSYASSVTNYSDLVASLRAGVPVSAVIDVEKCKYLNDYEDTWEVKTLGARFDDIFERVAPDITNGKKMRLVAASSHDYVGRDSVHLIRSLVRIFEDGTTEVITQEIDPTNYKVLENTFLICQLTADGEGGVSLVTIAK